MMQEFEMGLLQFFLGNAYHIYPEERHLSEKIESVRGEKTEQEGP